METPQKKTLKRLRDAIESTRSYATVWPKLGPALAKTSLDAVIAEAGEVKNTAEATGGIASPLVEVSYASRTYHTNKYLRSQDGLILIPAIKKSLFVDANGGVVEIEFASPP